MAYPRITDDILDALRRVESGGGKYLRSPAGALGPYQFMPATAREMGIDPMDEVQSRAAAKRLLEQHLARFGGNLDQALMAYHAGAGNVSKHLEGKPSGVGPKTLAYPGKINAARGQSQPIQVASADPGFVPSPREETIPAPDSAEQTLFAQASPPKGGNMTASLFGAPQESGSLFEGGFNFSPAAGGAWAMSPQDRFMALMQGLSSAGTRMAQSGQGGWKGVAMGLGGLGEGIAKGGQQALMQRLLGQRYEDAQKKAAREKQQEEQREAYIATLPPEQQALARANPGKFVETSITNSLPKQAETPFGARVVNGRVEPVPGANDYFAGRAGATKAAEQAAEMPYVGPKAASAAAATLPYDIQRAWGIPRVEPPGSRVVAGGAPGQPMQVISQSPTPAPGTQEGKYSQGVGELQGETVKGWRAGAETAFVTQQNVGRMREALDAGLKTGTFAPVRQVAVNALRDLLPAEAAPVLDRYFNATDSKQFDSASKELVVAIAKTLGPNPTNTDRDFIEAIGPRLKDNPDAVRSLLDWMDKRAQSKIDLYEQGYEHASKGGDPLKFEQDWWKKARQPKSAAPNIDDLLKKYAP